MWMEELGKTRRRSRVEEASQGRSSVAGDSAGMVI